MTKFIDTLSITKEEVLDRVKNFDIDAWFDQVNDITCDTESDEIRTFGSKVMAELGDSSLPLDIALRVSKSWPAELQQLWQIALQEAPAVYALNTLRVEALLTLMAAEAKVRG